MLLRFLQSLRSQLKLLPRPAFATRTVIMSVALAMVVVVTGLVIFFRSGQTPSPAPKILSHASIALNSKLTGFYPANQNQSSDQIIQSNIYEGLTGYDSQNNIVGLLATSWTNPDADTWNFSLRPNATFTNGASLKVEDVVFSLQQAQQQHWPASEAINNIASVSSLNDHQVQIKTTQPDPLLLSKLTKIYILNKDKFNQKEKDQVAIGTGPYKLLSVQTGTTDTYTLQINPSYWGIKPTIQELSLLGPADPSHNPQLLLEHKVDAIADDQLTQDQLAQLQKSGNKLFAFGNGLQALGFDTQRDQTPYVNQPKNPFKDQRIRSAIQLALNLPQLATQLATPNLTAATQFAPSTVLGYDPTLSLPTTNLTKAKQLMKQAGYAQGFTVTMDVGSAFQPQAQAIAKQLKDSLNITVNLNPLTDKSAAFTKLGKRDTSLFYDTLAFDSKDLGAIGQVLQTSPNKITPEANTNWGGYSNPQADQLFQQLSTSFEPASRQSLIVQLQKLLSTDLPLVPVLFTNNIFVARSGLNLPTPYFYQWTQE